MQLTRRDLLKAGFAGVTCLTLPTFELTPAPKPAPKPVQKTIFEKLYEERWNRREKLLNKWWMFISKSQTPLDVDHDYWLQLELAQLLENQYIWNNDLGPGPKGEGFDRYSLPITSHVFGNVLPELVDVQALDKRADLIFWKDANDEFQGDSVLANKLKLHAHWSLEAIQDLKAIHGLDPEVELLAIMKEEMQLEFIRVAIADIKRAANKTEIQWEYGGSVNVAVENAISDIHKKVGIHKPPRWLTSWVITSPEMISRMGDEIIGRKFLPGDRIQAWETSSFGVNKVFERKTRQLNYVVYKDPLFPPNQILVGCKRRLDGYIFAPFIATDISPVMLDPNSFCAHRKLYSYVAKKMINPDYYTLINC